MLKHVEKRIKNTMKIAFFPSLFDKSNINNNIFVITLHYITRKMEDEDRNSLKPDLSVVLCYFLFFFRAQNFELSSKAVRLSKERNCFGSAKLDNCRVKKANKMLESLFTDDTISNERS